MQTLIIAGGAIVVTLLFAVILVVVALRSPEAKDPIQKRLEEYTITDENLSLEEIELSQGFYDRIILPVLNSIGSFAQRFTPQATLESARRRIEMAGNPGRINPAFFLGSRFVIALAFGAVVFLVYAVSRRSWVQGLALTALFVVLGFVFPDMWLSSRVARRKKAIFRAMPDALDLLTICVGAGLGFDAAMSRVSERWQNDLALEFGRVLQEVRLGKLRRDALREMAERLDVPEMTSFVAAVIQSEQLGVSMSKVLRVQSDQMRVRRRQMAEEEAQRAPIKIIFPIGLLIFPSLFIILLGPAIMILMRSQLGALFR